MKSTSKKRQDRNDDGPTHNERKILEAAAEVRQDPADSEYLAFTAKELVIATLPHSSPPKSLPEWSRTNRQGFTLSIRQGWTTNSKTGKREPLGYPSGMIPRLLLFWITQEAVRKKTRRLEMGPSLNSFLLDVGLSPATGGGRRSDAARLRLQMERLFQAAISFEYRDEQTTQYRNMVVTDAASLWWDTRSPDQAALWGSYIELGERFFHAITQAPVPIDVRVIRALKGSPMDLDLLALTVYLTFAYRETGKFVSWHELSDILGANYKSPHNLAKKAKRSLKRIAAFYSPTPFEDAWGGFQILPNRQMIPSKTLV